MSRPELTVGVVGAGAMGRGIMQVAAEGGITVLAYDARPGAAEEARVFVGRMFERQAEKGTISADAARAAASRVRVVATLEAVAGADVVIEAIVEDLAAKQQLFAALDKASRPDVILASNTSSLPVTAIASACQHRQRVAGLHFFNPVPLMKLVEVIPGLATAPDVRDALIALARRMGREPVVSADSPGFIVNHVGRAYVPEAARLVSEGIAAFSDIDRIMTGAPGFRLGPFALLDLIGADVSVAVMESIWGQYFAEPMYAPGPELKLRIAGGRLGQKTGQGWYAYENGKRRDPAVLALAPERSVETALGPKSVWVRHDDANPGSAAALIGLLVTSGITVDRSEHPNADSLIMLAPVGADLATTIIEGNFDPRRAVAVDMLFGLKPPRTLMVTPATDPAFRDAALALLAVDGAPVVVINDSPGFVGQRMVAHIINVACQVASRGVATPADIDRGTQLGLGYPFGPLAWGDQLGPANVLRILERLEDFYRDPRYRPSPWLKRRAMLGLSLLAPDGVRVR